MEYKQIKFGGKNYRVYTDGTIKVQGARNRWTEITGEIVKSRVMENGGSKWLRQQEKADKAETKSKEKTSVKRRAGGKDEKGEYNTIVLPNGQKVKGYYTDDGTIDTTDSVPVTDAQKTGGNTESAVGKESMAQWPGSYDAKTGLAIQPEISPGQTSTFDLGSPPPGIDLTASEPNPVPTLEQSMGGNVPQFPRPNNELPAGSYDPKTGLAIVPELNPGETTSFDIGTPTVPAIQGPTSEPNPIPTPEQRMGGNIPQFPTPNNELPTGSYGPDGKPVAEPEAGASTTLDASKWKEEGPDEEAMRESILSVMGDMDAGGITQKQGANRLVTIGIADSFEEANELLTLMGQGNKDDEIESDVTPTTGESNGEVPQPTQRPGDFFNVDNDSQAAYSAWVDENGNTSGGNFWGGDDGPVSQGTVYFPFGTPQQTIKDAATKTKSYVTVTKDPAKVNSQDYGYIQGGQ